MQTKTLVILAAGMGSRYGGAKQFDAVTPNGETLVDFSLFDAIRSGYENFVFVVRESILDDAKRAFNEKLKGLADVSYVCQDLCEVPERFRPLDRKKPWGTAHAVLAVAETINENFSVINADDLYGSSAFQSMASNSEDGFTLAGYRLGPTLSPNGPVSRGQCLISEDGRLEAIIERTGIRSENGTITADRTERTDVPLSKDSIVSTNFWGFTPEIFGLYSERFQTFLKHRGNQPGAEFLIPDAMNDLISAGEVTVRVIKTSDEWAGITYKEDREIAGSRIAQMRGRGVYPAKLW